MVLKKLYFLSFFLLTAAGCYAQVYPRDNSKLNYTGVYFEDELRPGALSYELTIYRDTAGDAQKNVFKKMIGKLPAFRVEDLDWGKSYVWKIEAYDKEHAKLPGGAPDSYREHRFG